MRDVVFKSLSTTQAHIETRQSGVLKFTCAPRSNVSLKEQILMAFLASTISSVNSRYGHFSFTGESYDNAQEHERHNNRGAVIRCQ